MKGYIVLLSVISILTSCSIINFDFSKEDIYKDEIIKIISQEEKVEEIQIITTQDIRKDELVVYSYYSRLNNRNKIGLCSAVWNDEEVILTDISGVQKETQIPITFSSIIHEPDNGESLIGNLYNTEYYMISYGAVYDERVEAIKLVYEDGSALMVPVIKGGYIIIRIGYISDIKEIQALDEYKSPEFDKYENVIYHEMLN